MEVKTRLVGIVASAELTGRKPLGDNRHYVKFSIREDSSGKEKTVEMPMTAFDGQLIDVIVGRTAVYEERKESAEGSFFILQRFLLTSLIGRGYFEKYANRF